MKKCIKRILCITICICSVFCVFTQVCLADNDVVYFTPSLLTAFDYSASTWVSSSTNRALLTLCALLDLGDTFDFTPDWSVTPGFVGIATSDNVLVILLIDENSRELLIYFAPGSNIVGYSTNDNVSVSAAEYGLKSVCDQCYENSLSDIVNVLEIMQEALDN